MELKNLHDALLDHLKRHHKNPEAAERNMHGRLVAVERLNDEINIKLSYSDSETKNIIAELEGFTNK